MDSKSKVIIITGASRGIGLCVVHDLLSRPEQHRVVVVARSTAPLSSLTSQFPGRVASMAGDLSNPDMAQRVVNLAVSRFGQLHGLVVNHAMIEPVQRIADADVSAWRSAYEVNFFSAVAIVKAAIPPLRATRGTIILVSSAASTTPYPSLGAYSSSKAALNNLTMLIKNEESNITTLAVNPGRVDTELHRRLREKHSKTMPQEDSAVFFQLKARGELMPPHFPGSSLAQLVLNPPASLSGSYMSYRNRDPSIVTTGLRSVVEAVL